MSHSPTRWSVPVATTRFRSRLRRPASAYPETDNLEGRPRRRRSRRPLTRRQREILTAVLEYSEERGYPPTLADLAERLSCTTSTAQGHVDRLIRKAALSRDGEGRRTLTIIDQGFLREFGSSMPLLGIANGGKKLTTAKLAELAEIEDLLPIPTGCVVVRVAGDSLSSNGICAGDMAIVDPDRAPKTGDFILVEAEDGNAVMGSCKKERSQLSVIAGGSRRKPVAVGPHALKGVVVGVARALA